MQSSTFRAKGKIAMQLTAVFAVLVSSVVWIGQYKAAPQDIPGSGVSAQLVASENLPDSVRAQIQDSSRPSLDLAQVLTYKITIAPGGYTGWHQHGGPHMIVVTSGQLTYYDTTCTGTLYQAGSSIVDPGFDVHVLMNHGPVDVTAYLTEMLPADGALQIDVPVLTNFCDWHGPAQSRNLPN